ncbi:hypothetical protein FPHYL_4709 [Fusarium phyllophilum]|uniref:Uncharacterized protein n=1 Tax=Fusarium phyllophilum TaxID=47803 RepID=A0A8H5JYY0_9HYPO|nr:hypothetical protein FPHYL_4709 [Fusarium phyllophilum]
MAVNFLALDFKFVLGTSDLGSTAAEGLFVGSDSSKFRVQLSRRSQFEVDPTVTTWVGIQTAIVGDVSYLLRLNVDCARENLDDDDNSVRGTTCRSNRPFQNIIFFQESRQLCTDISAILRSYRLSTNIVCPARYIN